jgi:prepilin-type N-terminal cleavage/methylation domain-containing protein
MSLRIGRRPGFTLLEMIMALALLGAFMTAATRLFYVSFRTIHSTELSRNQAARMDHFLAELRRDVWAARRATVSESGELALELEGRRITWSAAEGGVHRLEAGPQQQEAVRTWTSMPKMRFAATPSGVELLVSTAQGDERIELVLGVPRAEAKR